MSCSGAARRRAAACVAVVSVLAVAACAQPAALREATVVKKPEPVLVEPDYALSLGPESMYEMVNKGNYRDADALLNDVWNIPRFEPVKLPMPLTWTENPYKEKYWTFVFYGMRMTSNLLWAFYRSGKVEYRDKLVEILRTYLTHDETNPAPDLDKSDDPHALAFRSMILTNTYVKLRRSGDLPPDLEGRLPAAIARIGDKLMMPEYFQGRYNHGFTQAVALILLHQNFGAAPSAPKWGELGRQRLDTFMRQSVDADGVEIEKSPFYHFYVFDFALQLRNWATANGVELSATFSEALNKMIPYSTQIIWPDGTAPTLGSSVGRRPRGKLDLYSDTMRDNPEFAFTVTSGEQGTPPAAGATLFRSSGQAILRSGSRTRAEYASSSQILLDAGSVQGEHSHHEALAFNYFSNGQELIADSGLDTYSKGQAYSYFHGTSAHNTIMVDDRDQDGGSVRPGATITGDGWSYQSGTATVYSGVTHRRAVLLLRKDLVLVADTVSSAQPHTFDQLWHLFPEAHVLVDGSTTRVFDQYDNPKLAIVQANTSGAGQVREYYGSLNPMQGWYSVEYGQTQPAHAVEYGAPGTSNSGTSNSGTSTSTTYLTLLASGQYAAGGAKVRGSITGDQVAATVCAGNVSLNVGIDQLAMVGERVSVSTTKGCTDGD